MGVQFKQDQMLIRLYIKVCRTIYHHILRCGVSHVVKCEVVRNIILKSYKEVK